MPVFNQPAVPNMFADFNLPYANSVPIQLAQLANIGTPVNYGYGQNLQINNLPFNSVPVYPPIGTKSPKTVLVKLNIPIVQRVAKHNLPLYNNIQYTHGNNLQVPNLPLNNQIINLINNLPVNTVPRETIHPVNYVQQRLPFSVNNRVVTNVPVVPLNRLSYLPTFNGMPVIKVKKTVYKLV